MNKIISFSLGYFLCFLSLVTANDAGSTSKLNYKVPWGESVVYKKVDGRELSLFIQKPVGWSDSDERTAVLFYHGGGWRMGSPNAFNMQAKYLTLRGAVCIQAEYRLVETRDDLQPIVCIQDAQSAMRWVRAHASELGIDSGKIIAAGGSAGGHLATYLATNSGMDDPQDDLTVSTRPAGLILFNPVVFNGPDRGFRYDLFEDDYMSFSPYHNISEGMPPVLFMVGTEDPLIPLDQSKQFKEKVESVGGECELVLFPGQEHGFFHGNRNGGANYYRCMVNVDDFLVRHGWLEGKPLYKEILRGKTFSMEGY